jgi:glycosyltransferase involved in cell wall biosynthesis
MIDSKPKVSIGLPVYNGENFLAETLDSLLAQTFQDFEIVISDNASTDATEKICTEYASKDKRIRYSRNQQNLGAAHNYNQVFERSIGKYFKWSAHDDLCEPEFLEQCVNILDSIQSVVLCYPGIIYINDEGEHLQSCSNLLNLRSPKAHERFGLFQDLLCNQPGLFDRWTVVFGLIRADILRKTPLIGGYIGSDLILLANLTLLGKFYEIPKHLLLVRQHAKRSIERSYTDIAVWFDPNNKGKIVFPLWNEFLKQVNVVKKSELKLAEKFYCYAQMKHWLPSRWKRLVKELFMVSLLYLERLSLWKFKAKVVKW